MIELRVNNQYVDLDEKAKFSITYNNAFFHFSESSGAYSFPFTLPLTVKNKLIFNQAHLVESRDKVRFYEFDLWANGVYINSGVLKLQQADKTGFSVNLNIGVGQLVKNCGTLKLKDLNLGTDNLNFTNTKTVYVFEIIRDKKADNTAYTATTYISYVIGFQPIYGQYISYFVAGANFDTSVENTIQKIANNANSNFQGFGGVGWKAYANGNSFVAVPPDGFDIALVNTVYASVLLGVGNQENYSGYTYTAKEYKISPSNTKYCFPYLYNPKFYDDKLKGFNGFINKAITNDGGENYYMSANSFLDGRFSECLVPFLRVKYILNILFSQIGMTWSGEFKDDAMFDNLLLYNNYALDKQAPITNTQYNEGQTALILSEHVPDITLTDFLTAIKNNFGMYYIIKDNNVEFRYRNKDIDSNSYTDITTKVQGRSLSFEDTSDYLVKFSDDVNYESAFSVFENFLKFGETSVQNTNAKQEESIELNCGTMHRSNFGMCVDIQEKGNSDLYGIGKDNSKRLAFVLWENYFNYANHTIGTYSLKVDGDFGLYNKYWLKYLTFLAKQEKNAITALLNTNDVNNFDVNMKQRIDTNEFLVLKTKINFSNNPNSLDSFQDYDMYTV